MLNLSHHIIYSNPFLMVLISLQKENWSIQENNTTLAIFFFLSKNYNNYECNRDPRLNQFTFLFIYVPRGTGVSHISPPIVESYHSTFFTWEKLLKELFKFPKSARHIWERITICNEININYLFWNLRI